MAGSPPARGGDAEIDPSTSSQPTAVSTVRTRSTVPGEIALRSATSGRAVVRRAALATDWAASTALAGGTTDTTRSLALTSWSSVVTVPSPARVARSRVRGLRPVRQVSTLCPPATQLAPRALPMAPAPTRPIVVMARC